MKNWDDPNTDVHIDKLTNFKVREKHRNVRICIPINSDREIRISSKDNNGSQEDVPNKLQKEIKNALNNKDIVSRFMQY
jgi:hypothetical protein